MSFQVHFESTSNMEAFESIGRVLKDFAQKLKVDIYVSNPHGQSSAPCNIPGRLYLRFWSVPIDTDRIDLEKAFGYRLLGSQSNAKKPSGSGTVIYDYEDVPVAEFYQGTLYVLFDLPHDVSNLALVLMHRIMEEYCRVIMGDAKQRRKINSKSNFVELFRRKDGLLIMSPDLIEMKWEELISVSKIKPVVYGNRIKVVIGPIVHGNADNKKAKYGTFDLFIDVVDRSVTFFAKSEKGKDHPCLDYDDGTVCLGNADSAMDEFIKE